VNDDDLHPEDFRALAEFRYQIRAFLHFSEEAARVEGLSPQQHQLLLALKGFPDGARPTVMDIAERLHLRHHSAVELTNRMVATGMIRKSRDREDRRRAWLLITARGEAVLRRLSLTHREQLQSRGKDLIRAVQKILKENEGAHEKGRR
jgi:DNA-binding MarR family transcriptional regulator